MRIVYQPRLPLQISPEWSLIILTLLLVMAVLWLISLMSIQPTERAVPQPVIARETPRSFY
ncbi:hypothetical protein [Vampirovibrio sp.]|uniref:hypothetical protein n=1 Tax=Vampirovibrio sp. TaxID=2717857 RepID=UPI0035937B7B